MKNWPLWLYKTDANLSTAARYERNNGVKTAHTTGQLFTRKSRMLKVSIRLPGLTPFQQFSIHLWSKFLVNSFGLNSCLTVLQMALKDDSKEKLSVLRTSLEHKVKKTECYIKLILKEIFDLTQLAFFWYQYVKEMIDIQVVLEKSVRQRRIYVYVFVFF